jgi:hypothetical protein
MRRGAYLLIRLYPANWRERYGEEFEALVEDSSPGWTGIFDLLKGAIKMHLSVPTFPKLALMLSVTGLLAGLLISALVTPRYVSTSELTFEVVGSTHAPASRDLREDLMQSVREIFSRTSLSGIIQDPRLDLYREERARMPLEDVIEKMKKDILIRPNGPGSAGQDRLPFSVSFTYRDRVKAHDTVDVLLGRFIRSNLSRAEAQDRARQSDQFQRLDARLAAVEKRLGIPSATPVPGDKVAAGYGGMILKVLDPPSLPVVPVYPDRLVFMATGFGAGIAAAVVIAVFRRRPPPIPFPAQTA